MLSKILDFIKGLCSEKHSPNDSTPITGEMHDSQNATKDETEAKVELTLEQEEPYVIDAETAKKRIEIRLKSKCRFDNIVFVCLSKSGKIICDSDFVFYNSECRGDGVRTIPFDKNKYNGIDHWRDATKPTSLDNALWIDDDVFYEKYGFYTHYGTMYLAKLREEIDEIIIVYVGFDIYNEFKGWFGLNKKDGITIDLELYQADDSYTQLFRTSLHTEVKQDFNLKVPAALQVASIKRHTDGAFVIKKAKTPSLITLQQLIDQYV